MTVPAAIAIGIGISAAVHLVVSATRTEPDRDAGASPRTALAGTVLIVAAVATLGYLVGATVGGAPGVGLPIAVLSLGAPRALRTRRSAETRRRVREAWPDAIQSLVGGLLSGRSLHQAMCDLAEAGPEALQPFWRRYRRLSGTLDQTAALSAARDEIGDPFVDRLVEVLIAAGEVGPASAIDILTDLASAAADDLHFENRVASAGLEQKINSRVVAIVPSIALLVLVWTNGAAREYYSTSTGVTVAAIGAVVSGTGILIVDRLGRLTAEPRVFGVGSASSGGRS
ncbi:MAG: type II secretion system F family protein [Actinomycetota bacterium]